MVERTPGYSDGDGENYHAFKVKRARDENEVTILDACAVQGSLPCSS